MVTRISYNVHGLNVPDKKRLLDHLAALQPSAVLVLDNLDLSREIKRLLPNTTVIFREYGSQGDKDLHTRHSAQEWLDAHAHQAEGGITLHVINEPPFNQAVIDWYEQLLTLAAPRGIPLVIGNWAVGNPEPEQWAMAKDLLLLLDQHRNLFILGLHEYAGGVVTSGLYGGYPDNAGVAPGKPGGLNLIPPENWPKSVDGVTCYHMGRFKFLRAFCNLNSIPMPRVILTEHGFDDTSDIKAWEETLQKTSPYLSIRGWKTLRNQWHLWFLNTAGWSHERAYFEQLAWADRTIYQHSPVEAQCVFCWGHSSAEWEQFDVAGAGEFQRLLEEYAKAAPPQEVEVMPVPKPANASDRTYVKLTGAPLGEINVRTGPGEWFRAVATVRNGEAFRLYRTPPVSDNRGRKWFYADTMVENGWVCEVEPDIFVPVTNGAKPPILPAINWEQDIAALRSQIDAAQEEKATYQRQLDEAKEKLAAIQAEFREQFSSINHLINRVQTRITALELVRADLETLKERVP